MDNPAVNVLSSVDNSQAVQMRSQSHQQKIREEQLQHQNEELEMRQDLAQEARQLQSELLANLSHELRTPLNGIIGFAELMHDGRVGPVSATHKEYLGDILTSARHLLQLLNNLLDLSRVEPDPWDLCPELIEPAKLVGEIQDLLRTQAARKRIRLEVHIDPALDRLVVDAVKLKRVLYSYLAHAVRLTPSEGRVTICLRVEGADAFLLEVAYPDSGIQGEVLDRLFVEPEQPDAGPARHNPGVGLGLPLAKRIVEAQGGRVGVRSSPGQGSVFFAVLPRMTRVSVDAAVCSVP